MSPSGLDSGADEVLPAEPDVAVPEHAPVSSTATAAGTTSRERARIMHPGSLSAAVTQLRSGPGAAAQRLDHDRHERQHDDAEDEQLDMVGDDGNLTEPVAEQRDRGGPRDAADHPAKGEAAENVRDAPAVTVAKVRTTGTKR